MHFLTETASEEIRRLYENRKAIRLIDFPFKTTDALKPYFKENVKIPPEKKWQSFTRCPVSIPSKQNF